MHRTVARQVPVPVHVQCTAGHTSRRYDTTGIRIEVVPVHVPKDPYGTISSTTTTLVAGATSKGTRYSILS